VRSVGGEVVTLVEGSCFCLSLPNGDLLAGHPHGLFVGDTRVVSRLQLYVDGAETESLAVVSDGPFSATFVSRGLPPAGWADSTLLVVRRRYVGGAMREDIQVQSFSDKQAAVSIDLRIGTDFADLFAVKEQRENDNDCPATWLSDGLRRSSVVGGTEVAVDVSATGDPTVSDEGISWEVVIPPQGAWSACIEVDVRIAGRTTGPRYRCGEPPGQFGAAQRLERWRAAVPVVETDHPELGSVVSRSVEDLAALRLIDPEFPERAVIAAGAPWFMALFGRDSILSSWMALPIDPTLALGVAQTLARFQGTRVDRERDEQPGRILHELRFGGEVHGLGPGLPYYGSVDATPLFVTVVGELRRWGIAPEAVHDLLPNVDRALAWIEEFGDLDGDGYVEYQRMTERGLANQGWKDSWDGIRYASGDVAESPIALSEVQGYIYAAYLTRAGFAADAGDVATRELYLVKARELKRAFNKDFWLPEKACFALGLDASKQPIDSVTSNIGHCLWSGIVDESHAASVAGYLLSDDLFTGWGIRTLAGSMGGFNPISYHCGSVWPHDTAIATAGLCRYGFEEEAARVMSGLLDAAAELDYRLPELFGGLGRSEFPSVVRYPTSCSPQAWSAASSLLLLRAMLGFEPAIQEQKLRLWPVLPEGVRRLKVGGIRLVDSQVTVSIEDGELAVEGLPDGVVVERSRGGPDELSGTTS